MIKQILKYIFADFRRARIVKRIMSKYNIPLYSENGDKLKSYLYLDSRDKFDRYTGQRIRHFPNIIITLDICDNLFNYGHCERYDRHGNEFYY